MYDNFSYAPTLSYTPNSGKKSVSAVRRDIRFFIHILEDKKVKPFANVISKAALSSQLFTTLSVGRAGVCSLPRRRSQGFVTSGAGTRDETLRTSAWEANDTRRRLSHTGLADSFK